MKIVSLFDLLTFKKYQSPWWIQINTSIPKCIYFFGPFDNAREAKFFQDGYVEDLLQEKALGITVEIKKMKPKNLTIFEE
ncbi:DUF1816 domain-containing protein [Pleurocapsales cyanobacterium LEGE 06147]|nr:DUF1816 domain-containing protein [Pleurocapsales cyanobacterium LEGE 06147]